MENKDYYNLLLEKVKNKDKEKAEISYGDLLLRNVEKIEERHKRESENRYGNLGNLLKTVKSPEEKLYEDMSRLEDTRARRMKQEAAEKRQADLKRQQRIEKELLEEQEFENRINTVVNNMIAKNKAEQEAIKKLKKEEAEKEDIYKTIERFKNPESAERYIKAMIKANKL